jgi:hypothetical protein
MRVDIKLECDTNAYTGDRRSKLEEMAFAICGLAVSLQNKADAGTNPFPADDDEGGIGSRVEYLEDSQGNECGTVFFVGECNEE